MLQGYNQKAYKELETLFSGNEKITIRNDYLNLQFQKLKEESEILKKNYFDIIEKNNELIKTIEEIKQINEKLNEKNQELSAQNNMLIEKNKELLKDNIALQNSLKMAASVGIKPQNYTLFTGFNINNDTINNLNKGQYIGKFLGTAYTPSVEECGNNHGITNSGKPIIPGISIAIDKEHWPFGTIFYIEGLGYTIAMDTGSSVKGKYRFDFAVFDKEFAKTLGSRKWDVYLVKMGNGIVDESCLHSLHSLIY